MNVGWNSGNTAPVALANELLVLGWSTATLHPSSQFRFLAGNRSCWNEAVILWFSVVHMVIQRELLLALHNLLHANFCASIEASWLSSAEWNVKVFACISHHRHLFQGNSKETQAGVGHLGCSNSKLQAFSTSPIFLRIDRLMDDRRNHFMAPRILDDWCERV